MRVGLVQINNELPGRAYHPYSVGCLQAYALANLKNPGAYEFLLPVFQRIPVRDAVTQLINADIVAFSSYVWNEQLQLEIARTLKKLRPSIGIIFGGPQVPHPFDEKKPWIPNFAEQYLREHPFIDVLGHGEGEQLFTALLENWHGDWENVFSISFLRNDSFKQTPHASRVIDFSDFPSPYLSGIFDPLMTEYPDMQWNVLFETNRGCPYACTFCGWGGPVMKKPIPFPMERISQELEWIGKNRGWRIWCCDANFGIFERDIEIAREVVKVKSRYGFPEILYVQSAKNFSERMYEIHKILNEARMELLITLAFQSTDIATLANVKRSNIRPEFYRGIQARANRDRIPTSTDLILPLPGETYESFVNGACEVIESGGTVQFNPLSIEPDAEMADPQYQGKFGIELVVARVMNLHGKVSDKGISRVEVNTQPRDNFTSDAEWILASLCEMGKELYELQKLVIATSSMPKSDFVRAKVFSWMTQLVYFNKLLIIPLVVLHKGFGLKYKELLTLFSDTELDSSKFPVLTRIQSLFGDKAREIQQGGYELSALNGTWWPVNEYAVVLIVKKGKLSTFYDEAERLFKEFLDGKTDIVIPKEILEESILLNQELLKLPKRSRNLDLELSYNIGSFFNGFMEMKEVVLEKRSSRVEVSQTEATWNFDSWCREVMDKGHKSSKYLYDFKAE